MGIEQVIKQKVEKPKIVKEETEKSQEQSITINLLGLGWSFWK